MASSGDDLEEDIHGQDGSGKKSGKKFLHPFRKMRRFFSSRRRGKSRGEGDEGEDGPPPSGAVKSKSTTDVLRAARHNDDDDPDDESGQFVSNKTLSMSADSVFTPDPRTKDTSLEALQSSARSMEHLGQPPFTNELFQKLKSRRNEDDEGLPSSPVTQSTADVLEDFKKPIDKRHDSKHSVDSSMFSSDDELEDKNVFDQGWTSVINTSRQNVSAITDSQERLDLDAVSSTQSLVSSAVRHKLQVKPRGVRPSTQHRRPPRATTPQTLPQLEETEEVKEEKDRSTASLKVETKTEKKESPKVEVKELVSNEDKESADEKEPEDTKVEIQVQAEIETPADRKKQSDSSRDADVEDEVAEEKEEEKVEEKEKRKSADKPLTIVIPKTELKVSPKTSPVPPPKSPKPSKKEIEEKRKSAEIAAAAAKTEPPKTPEEKKIPEPEKSPAADEPTEATPFGIVKLRKTGRRTAIEEKGTLRLREAPIDRDPSKRQTIAGDQGLAIFGDRKPANRNSFVEVSRSPPEQPKEESGESEFSQVLNRLKKQPSRKKLIPDEKQSEAEKPATSLEKAPSQSSKEKAVIVESKPKISEAKAKIESPKPKVSENKPKLPEGKPKIESKPKIEIKPRIAESKPKVADTKPKVGDIKAKIAEANKASETHGPKEVKKEEVKPVEAVPTKTDVPKPKEKEVLVISKKPEPVKAKEPEVKLPTTPPVSASPQSQSEPEKKPQTESKPLFPKSPTTKTPTLAAKSEPGKAIIIEKPKLAEPKKPEVVEKVEPKTPPAKEVKFEEKIPAAKKDTQSLVKNQVEKPTTTTTTATTTVQGANKENEKSSQPQSIQRSTSQSDDDKSTSNKPVTPTEKPNKSSGSDGAPTKTAEPAWFTLARRKTANWDQKERDLEQKEKKETSNQAEKERDAASTKGKEVTLTIDEAAKEESKPALRTAVKCSNSAANRQSKVLDMAKLFQNQVS